MTDRDARRIREHLTAGGGRFVEPAGKPRIRPERFTTQPGEVRLGKFDAAGRWRPLTAAEATERGVTDYDPKTGKAGIRPGSSSSAR